MRPSIFHVLTGVAIWGLASLSATPSFAKSTRQCTAEYAAKKEKIDEAGLTRDGFMTACRGNQTRDTGVDLSRDADVGQPRGSEPPSLNTTPRGQIPVGGIRAPLTRD
jgi:hypothetical protein